MIFDNKNLEAHFILEAQYQVVEFSGFMLDLFQLQVLNLDTIDNDSIYIELKQTILSFEYNSTF